MIMNDIKDSSIAYPSQSPIIGRVGCLFTFQLGLSCHSLKHLLVGPARPCNNLLDLDGCLSGSNPLGCSHSNFGASTFAETRSDYFFSFLRHARLHFLRFYIRTIIQLLHRRSCCNLYASSLSKHCKRNVTLKWLMLLLYFIVSKFISPEPKGLIITSFYQFDNVIMIT